MYYIALRFIKLEAKNEIFFSAAFVFLPLIAELSQKTDLNTFMDFVFHSVFFITCNYLNFMKQLRFVQELLLYTLEYNYFVNRIKNLKNYTLVQCQFLRFRVEHYKFQSILSALQVFYLNSFVDFDKSCNRFCLRSI